MNLVKVILGTLPLAVTAVCVATTVSQAALAGWMWSAGMFSDDKLVRYAAVLYGLDLSEVPDPKNEDQPLGEELLTREEIREARVEQSELLQNRITAVEKGTAQIQFLFESLRSNNDRYEQMKGRFDAHLGELEQDARAAAIQELQRTLEVLQAKQAKDLLLLMLEDRDRDANDDVLQDIVTMIKSMPEDKRRRILGAFKTEAERESLHQILVEIGDLEPEPQA